MDKKILILGGGFGGIRTALTLNKLLPNQEITLISDVPYHCFRGDLYQVSTAVFKKERKQNYLDLLNSVSIPLKLIFKNTKVNILIRKITGINLEKKEIELEGKENLSFDYVVVALGSTSSYYGIEGAENFSHPLKGAEDALNIRDDIVELTYGLDQKPSNKISLVIAGGGFTGLELAGEMGKLVGKFGKITIVEGSSSVLNGMPDWAQEKAFSKLQQSGVKVLLNFKIKKVSQNKMVSDTGQEVPFDYLIWTTGVCGTSLKNGIKGVGLNKKDQLEVLPDLSLKDFPNVFVVGDFSSFPMADGKSYVPPAAWAAIEEGEVAAKNLKKRLEVKQTDSYIPPTPYFVVPVGDHYALSNVFNLKITDSLAWILKQFIALKYFLSILPVPLAFKIWLKGEKIYLDSI